MLTDYRALGAKACHKGNRRSPMRPRPGRAGKHGEELTARFGERLNALGGVGRYYGIDHNGRCGEA